MDAERTNRPVILVLVVVCVGLLAIVAREFLPDRRAPEAHEPSQPRPVPDPEPAEPAPEQPETKQATPPPGPEERMLGEAHAAISAGRWPEALNKLPKAMAMKPGRGLEMLKHVWESVRGYLAGPKADGFVAYMFLRRIRDLPRDDAWTWVLSRVPTLFAVEVELGQFGDATKPMKELALQVVPPRWFHTEPRVVLGKGYPPFFAMLKLRRPEDNQDIWREVSGALRRGLPELWADPAIRLLATWRKAGDVARMHALARLVGDLTPAAAVHERLKPYLP